MVRIKLQALDFWRRYYTCMSPSNLTFYLAPVCPEYLYQMNHCLVHLDAEHPVVSGAKSTTIVSGAKSTTNKEASTSERQEAIEVSLA